MKGLLFFVRAHPLAAIAHCYALFLMERTALATKTRMTIATKAATIKLAIATRRMQVMQDVRARGMVR